MREEKILRLFQEYFASYGDLAVPRNLFVVQDKSGKKFDLGEELSEIKKQVKGKEKKQYSDDFYQTLQNMDERVFEDFHTINVRRELHEEKILKCCEEYLKEHGNLAIPQDYVVEGVIPIELGRAMERVKKFVRGENDYVFNQKFVDELLKMDKRVFEENYSINLAREAKEEKLLRMFKQYYKTHEDLAISARYVHTDFETGEKHNLGKELCCMKEFLSGVGNRKYNEDFIEKVREIDPRVYEKNYPNNLKREKREKI